MFRLLNLNAHVGVRLHAGDLDGSGLRSMLPLDSSKRATNMLLATRVQFGRNNVGAEGRDQYKRMSKSDR